MSKRNVTIVYFRIILGTEFFARVLDFNLQAWSSRLVFNFPLALI